MSDRADWSDLKDRRMREPGAQEAYDGARIAFELGRTVRALREQKGWTQTQLAQVTSMTQPAVARFEAGGVVPTLPILERFARALEVELSVEFRHKPPAA